MSTVESTSKTSGLAILPEVGRVNRVTLGLLLSTRLQVSVREADTSGLARLERAMDGLIMSGRDYEQAVSIFASPLLPASTFGMWLTQYATIQGYLLASGVSLHAQRSIRIRSREILATSAARHLFDGDAFTIKRERARALTRWALGAGRFNRDMPLETIWQRLWQAENAMRNGLQPTSETGLTIEE